MSLGQKINIFQDWFNIYYVENPGMAFGLEWGGQIGKYSLTGFRIIAIGFIIYYISRLIKDKAHTGLITTMSLILAGAIGNLLDSLFYGLIFDSGTTFNESINRYVGYNGISEFSTSGYASFMQGCVVDMLHFPLFYWPDWIPFLGGSLFFSPIFNIADSAITVGVFLLLIFQSKFFKEK